MSQFVYFVRTVPDGKFQPVIGIMNDRTGDNDVGVKVTGMLSVCRSSEEAAGLLGRSSPGGARAYWRPVKMSGLETTLSEIEKAQTV